MAWKLSNGMSFQISLLRQSTRCFRLIAATFALSTTALAAEIPLPSSLEMALRDVFHWEQFDRTRSIYVPSPRWQEHCDAFYGPDLKANCIDLMEASRQGEKAIPGLIVEFGLEQTVRDRGWIVFYMPENYSALAEEGEEGRLRFAWLEVLGKLSKNYSPPESAGCGRDYPCSFIFRFDRHTLQLSDIDFLSLKPR